MKRDEDDILYYSRMLKSKNGNLKKSTEFDDGLDEITEGLDLDFLSDLFPGTQAKTKKIDRNPKLNFKNSNSTDENEDDSLNPDETEDEDEDGDADADEVGVTEILSNNGLNNSIPEDPELNMNDLVENPIQPQRLRENPYVPPVASPAKYIPPSMRKKLLEQSSSNSEQQYILKRRCQGLLNRLSEANIASIVDEFISVFSQNPRQQVTSVITSCVIEMTGQSGVLADNFVVVYGAMICALYKHIGLDFAAYFVQVLVEAFETAVGDPLRGKESSNLIVLLSQLYTFQVVGCALIYDFIRLYIHEITELHTELLLKLIMNSGSQLRHDDPSALKDIITVLQESVRKIPSDKMNSRTKFLIEMVSSWKNNRLKASSTITAESITRMRKYLGKIQRTTEPLRVTLDDIRHVETRGKWWLVGSAWAGADDIIMNATASATQDVDITAVKDILDHAEPNWLELAREQRMNTDIRRAIFVAIMGSEDYVDANERILGLKLKRVQEREIPRVLLHCCTNEKEFNPFYAYVASTLCKEHSMRKTFQFIAWDFFKQLDGSQDDSDSGTEESTINDIRFVGSGDVDEKTQRRMIKSYARFYAIVVGEAHLSLDLLKNINFLLGSPEMEQFLQQFFTALFSHIRVRTSRQKDKLSGEKALIQLVIKIKDNTVLLKGIEYFLKTRLETTKKSTEWGLGILSDTIERLETSKEY
ncbi:uncharacterized protein V1516DRAFT_618166 [Lipomyces oligophaga]|uniref:uncharacterized protein n=1 Tax=Lipomyces oligophaga TaxID=45792 RepID=UPI0034CF43EB